jgi:alpha-1,6-mannosyltransferase
VDNTTRLSTFQSERIRTRLRDQLWVRSALLAAATATSLAVVFASRRVALSVIWVLASGATCAVLVVLEQRRTRLSIRLVVFAVGLVIAVAVVVPSRSSNDLWSYTMYGRTVTVHHASPYRRVPADYPSDPFLTRVSPRWRHTGSVYGPLFVGVASAGTLVASDSALISRLFFQVLAALALVAILVIVWRRTRSTAAVLWLGLNPVLGIIVVNGGHNDAFVGLALLVAALLLGQGRGRAAGVTIGVAMLIKLSAGLGLIGAVLWAWEHRRRRLALTIVVAASTVCALGYVPVLASASEVLGAADKTVTNASVWNVLVDRILRHDAGRNVPNPLAPNTTLSVVFYLSATAVLLLAVGLGSRAARHRQPEPAVGVAVASYAIAGQYTFPWYAIWALPLLATRRLSGTAWIVWTQSIVMLAALRLPDAVNGNAPHVILRAILTMAAPTALLLAFVVAVVRDEKRIRSPRRAQLVQSDAGLVMHHDVS